MLKGLSTSKVQPCQGNAKPFRAITAQIVRMAWDLVLALTLRKSRSRRSGCGDDRSTPLRLKHAGTKTFQFAQLRRELFQVLTQQHSGINRLTMMFSHVVEAPKPSFEENLDHGPPLDQSGK